MNWHDYLSKEIQHYLDKIVVESFSQKYAIELAKDKNKAQMLVSLAILYKKIAELELKTNYLERVLKQFFPKKGLSEKEKKKREAEAEQFIKSLVRGEIKTTAIKTKKIGRKPKTKAKKSSKHSTIKIAKSL